MYEVKKHLKLINGHVVESYSAECGDTMEIETGTEVTDDEDGFTYLKLSGEFFVKTDDDAVEFVMTTAEEKYELVSALLFAAQVLIDQTDND